MVNTTIQNALAQAMDHHRAGRLREAEAGYRAILQQKADQPDALHLLGVIALQGGNPAAAMELIGKSLRVQASPGAYNNLGEANRHQGRLEDALAAYRKSIELNPRQVDAYSNMALAFSQANRHADAAEAMERACEAGPGRIDLLGGCGTAWALAGDAYRAAAAFRKILAIDANHVQALAHLSTALAATGALDEAITMADRAVELAPNDPTANGCRGVVLDKLARKAEAVESFARAASLAPRVPDYYGHRATILEHLGRLDEAVEVLQQGIRSCAPDVRLHSNLSSLLRRRRRYSESVDAADAALKLMPGYSEAHGNRALSLLSLGDYDQGLVEYEWRWRCGNFTTKQRDLNRPLWDGSDPRGRTLFVHTEQGYGDTIQFLRYIPLLADRGANVIIEVNHTLKKLVAGVRGVGRVTVAGLGLPEFDLHTPLLSLPRFFTKSIETIPRNVPYLSPDPQSVDAWRMRLGSGDSLRVGLIWAGNDKPDPNRNVPGALLSKLAGVEGVRFVGLQKHDAPTYSPVPPQLELVDVQVELTDFHETAAAMCALDLIVTIDTAGAHLAGALGRPTWCLVPWAPDWRWMDGRDDSPWYPTMRLFRQDVEGDWTGTLNRLAAELRAYAERRGEKSRF